MNPKKTYKGKTAGGYLRDAYTDHNPFTGRVIVHDDLPGCVLEMSQETGCLYILDTHGWRAVLTMSDRAKRDYEFLADRINELSKTSPLMPHA